LAGKTFLFYGDEDFLIRQRIAELKKKVANPSLNFEELDVTREVNVESIVVAIQTNPMLGGDKTVVIRNADLRDENWLKIIPFLTTLASGTTVVIWASNIDKRSKAYKALNKVVDSYEFKSFTEWEQDKVIAWISKTFKEAGKEIKTPAALRLQEICGNNLGKLKSEIDKIVTYVGERKEILEKDILTLASPGAVSSFVLSNAVADKNIAKALSAFRSLWRNKVSLFQLLPLLASQYRIMLQTTDLTPTQFSRIKANPYYVRKCHDKSKKFSQQELKNNLKLLLETDLRLKSGESPQTVFELLLTELCSNDK